MQARDLMTSPVITIGPDATIGEAARLMLDKDVSCLPVVDKDNRLVGILTHADFGLHPKYLPLAQNIYSMLGSTVTPQHLEEVSHQVSRKRVSEVMRKRVVTVADDASIAEVTAVMLRGGFHRLPVMRSNQLVGIITRHDFLKLIAANG